MGLSRAAGKFVNDYPLAGVIYALPRGPVDILKAAMATPGGGLLTDTLWRDLHSEDKFTGVELLAMQRRHVCNGKRLNVAAI